MAHTEINFHPMRSNVLDFVFAKGLQTPDGKEVCIHRPMTDFVIRIDGREVFRSSDNIAVSAFLNRLQVGRVS